MKKEALLLLFSCSLMMGAELEKQKSRESYEWDSQAYAQGNTFQEIVAFTCIQDLGIDFVGKNILDIGCGTGNISARIVQSAERVHGIDASKNMIEYAQATYGWIENLSFEECLAENFITQEAFDAVISFSCLHWIKDKGSVIENVNKALMMNGDFFGTSSSTSDNELIHLTVFKKIFPQCTAIHPYVKESDLIQMTDFHLISDEEFKKILESNGFEIISYEQKLFGTVVSKENFENALWPLIMSRPFMQSVPHEIKKLFFDDLINECLKLFVQNEEGNYIIPATMLTTKMFHARKIADV